MGRKSRFSKEQWAGFIAEQAASGLSAAKFCKQRNLRLPTFYQQRRNLTAECDEPKESSTMIPLQVVSGDLVDVELACGATIKLPTNNESASREILRMLLELGRQS